MKRFNNTSRIAIFAIILMYSTIALSQNTNESPTIINYAEWAGADLSALYDNCLTALHLNNMEIDLGKTNDGKEMKMIFTENISRQYLGFARTSFSLSMLIFKMPDNKVALNVNIKNPIIVSENNVAINKTFAASCIAGIAKNMENLFLQIENLQGKPILTKKTDITVKY